VNYGVTFPLFSKLDVKGSQQHPLYEILSEAADDSGKAGNVKWNFEKFLVGRDGRVVRRFRSKVVPEDPQLIGAINSLL
jgi:glutathione peroxidase